MHRSCRCADLERDFSKSQCSAWLVDPCGPRLHLEIHSMYRILCLPGGIPTCRSQDAIYPSCALRSLPFSVSEAEWWSSGSVRTARFAWCWTDGRGGEIDRSGSSLETASRTWRRSVCRESPRSRPSGRTSESWCLDYGNPHRHSPSRQRTRTPGGVSSRLLDGPLSELTQLCMTWQRPVLEGQRAGLPFCGEREGTYETLSISPSTAELWQTQSILDNWVMFSLHDCTAAKASARSHVTHAAIEALRLPGRSQRLRTPSPKKRVLPVATACLGELAEKKKKATQTSILHQSCTRLNSAKAGHLENTFSSSTQLFECRRLKGEKLIILFSSCFELKRGDSWMFAEGTTAWNISMKLGYWLSTSYLLKSRTKSTGGVSTSWIKPRTWKNEK